MQTIPVAIDIATTIALPALGYILVLVAQYLRDHRKYTRLAALADAASRVAGRIQRDIAALPPGTNIRIVEAAAIAAGVKELREEWASTIALTGGNDAKVAAMIDGEIGKLPALLPAGPVKEAIGMVVAAVSDTAVSVPAASSAAPLAAA